MKVTIDAAAKELVIRLPLTKPTESKSGKTKSIAGTGGFVKTGCIEPSTGLEISISVNTAIPNG